MTARILNTYPPRAGFLWQGARKFDHCNMG